MASVRDDDEGTELAFGVSLKDLKIEISRVEYDPMGSLKASILVADRDTGKLIMLRARRSMPSVQELEDFIPPHTNRPERQEARAEAFANHLRAALTGMIAHEVDELIRYKGARFFSEDAERGH